jgi:CHASE2 domain-containing sensor protein
MALLACSFAFHWYREKRFILADILAASVVIFICLALLFAGGFDTGYVLIAGLLVLAGLFIRYQLEQGRRGGMAHALWHLIAATVILSSILSYGTTL